jgi:hypothetical protein
VTVRRILALTVLALCAGWSAALGRPQPSAPPEPGPSAPLASPSSPAAPSASSPASAAAPAPQQYANFVKGAERQSGLIDIVRKDDDVYFDLTSDEFDRPFIVAPVLAAGVGAEAFAGRVFPSFLLEFKRLGRRVLWIQKNTDYSATPDSPAANALAISVADSVINSTPIVAEEADRSRVVVSANFFLSDFENVGRDLGGSPQPVILFGPAARPGFGVDATRSYFERTKALPKNDELLASLAFVGPAGTNVTGAPDPRGVRLRMHYSIVEPPAASTYVPRFADDRVGYFVTVHQRFDDDTRPTPFVRYIDRWNFTTRGPIVYYLTDEIPPQYKPTIRAALLAWNERFAQAGIPNAIEVREQPSDRGWDPDDVRYSTVRWIAGDQPSFTAYGPHIADPRTGEILRVEIVIDGEALRTIKRGYADQVAPLRRAANASSDCADDACDDFEGASAELAATGILALRLQGATYEQTQQYALQWLRAAVLHEAGHNFGLRHNFQGSTLYPLERLHDKSFTSAHGLVASVMDYTPVNLSPPGRPQGDYFQREPGPYDAWAIRYGYQRFAGVVKPADEALSLAKITAESTRPEYTYGSDEDANGPYAIDPRISAFDLSDDPLGFDANQFAVVDALVAGLDRIYPRDDRPYAEERSAFLTMMRTYERAALLTAKYVGGVYTSRGHRGQEGAGPPLRPVPRDRSRQAFELLAGHLFSSRAFRFSPQLLSDLGANHFDGQGGDLLARPDFPVSQFIAALQDEALFQLFSPAVMSRLADQRLRTEHPSSTMSLEDLFEWMQASVWEDVGRGMGSIDPLHRALQRRYATLLVAFALAPSFSVESLGYPSDTPSLARYELERLSAKLTDGLASPQLDIATRAHLEDLRSRVRHALDPNSVRGA